MPHLYEDEDIQISVIDVPGHERFIRQMIAGVAGIDLVVLVVAADEGVMPQTREHLDILGFLGIRNGIVAITKIDRVDEEFIDLVKDDILQELTGTVFENSPFALVDSLSKKGIEELKTLIVETLKEQEMRDAKGAFRLPIDQVFTVKGQGTVVRGTVYEGTIEEGQVLTVLPKGNEVRARGLQVHHKQAKRAFAGQRVAINLANVTKEDVERGDVIVSSKHFNVTRTLDVAMRVVEDLDYMVKQRTPIKCHIGTAEVMGRVVFFDRNELKEDNGEILCQLRLEEDIVTKRGDRFIIRRPSPSETIGGGWVIDPRGEKYRFGLETIEELEKKKAGTPKDRITAALTEGKSLGLAELIKRTALDEDTLKAELKNEEFLLYNGKEYTLKSMIMLIEDDVFDRLRGYHNDHPMKQGINKAELLQSMQKLYPKALVDYCIDQGVANGTFGRREKFVFLDDFTPHVPSNWQKRTENMLSEIKKEGLKVRSIQDYLKSAGIPEQVSGDLRRLLEDQGLLVQLDDQYYCDTALFEEAVSSLRGKTGPEFELGDAKDTLDLPRKYLIPFLERLDAKGYTKRVENKRVWQ